MTMNAGGDALLYAGALAAGASIPQPVGLVNGGRGEACLARWGSLDPYVRTSSPSANRSPSTRVWRHRARKERNEQTGVTSSTGLATVPVAAPPQSSSVEANEIHPVENSHSARRGGNAEGNLRAGGDDIADSR